MSKKSMKKMWRGSASCSWFIVCYFGTHQARLDSLGKLFLQGINIPTLHHELRAILKLHLQGGTRWTQSPFPAPGTPGPAPMGVSVEWALPSSGEDAEPKKCCFQCCSGTSVLSRIHSVLCGSQNICTPAGPAPHISTDFWFISWKKQLFTYDKSSPLFRPIW